MDGNDKHTPSATGKLSLTLDYDLFDHYLADADLTEDQKREFITVMWNLVVEMMSLGIEIHPVQQAQATCGKLSEDHTNPPNFAAEMVQSKGPLIETDFSNAATGESQKAAERIQK